MSSFSPVVEQGDAATASDGMRLGAAVNALFGYRAGWDPADPSSTPFFDAPAATLSERPAAASIGSVGTWGYPLISLHDTPESVISAIYDLSLVSGEDDAPATAYSSGALLTRNADRASALDTLQERYGIDFSVSGRGYALLEVRREAGTTTHPTFTKGIFRRPAALADAEDAATARLPSAVRVASGATALDSQADADAYLAYFAEHGTHYVRSIASGDRILQVLAYDAPQWQRLRSDYAGNPNLLTGPSAYVSFCYYLRPRTTAGFGMVAERGQLTIASSDPAFSQSVATGEWHDGDWADGDSAFTPFLSGTPELSSFTQVVPIGVELAPLALFMTEPRAAAARQVFRAAMAAIYAGHVSPAFPSAPDPTFGGVYPRASGLASVMATPTVSTYAERLDLAAFELALPQVVEQLGLVASLLELGAPGRATLPGSSVSLLAGIVNVMAAADGSVPVLTLADAAYASFELSCGSFAGALYVQNASGSDGHLIADGIVYERVATGPDGRYTAATAGDAHQPPAAAAVEALSVQLTAAVNAAEARLAAWQALAPAGGLKVVTKFADWIARLIPAGSEDCDLSLLRLDALYLARAAGALGQGIRQVPYLSYTAYQPAVDAVASVAQEIATKISDYQDQIHQRQIAEALVKDLGALNENVIQTGQLLSGYVGACADQQAQLADSYSDLAASDQQALQQTEATIATLQTRLSEQHAAVQTASENYQTAIGAMERDAIVDMCFDIVKDVFELGASMAAGIPEEDAAKQLAQIFKDIQDLVAVMDAIQKLAALVANPNTSPAAAESALDALGPQAPDILGRLKWDEFRAGMKNAIEKGPDLPSRADLLTAVDILVLRGQALIEAQASAATLIGRIYGEQRRQTIAKAQADRLATLQSLLHPQSVGDLDVADIDLIGLSGELAQLQGQMMVQLVRAVVMQDMALQYEYLQEPTAPPAQFDLISVGAYVAAQQNALLKAKTMLSPPPAVLDDPVSYTVAGIPTSVLADGGSFRFQIPLTAKQFQPYTMVRVARVDVAVEGLRATTGGQFVAQLIYRGEPFYDIDQQHQPVEFDTTARITNFLGRVDADGTSTASAGSQASGDYSLVTPFSEWELSFPADATNDGLAFSGASVDLTLRFHLVAQINSPPGGQLGEMDVTTPGGTAADMLTGMQGKSCLMGWDAVFSYSEEKVNAFLLAQYNTYKAKDVGHLVIPERTDTTPPDPNTGNSTYTTWSMTLGPPRVEFATGNNQYATVYLEILDAKYEYGIIKKGGEKIQVTIFPPPPIKAGAAIKGQVQLGKAQGSLTTQHDVVLDLPAGSWDAFQLDVDSGNPAFNTFLTEQLKTVSTSYTMGTLDMSSYATLPALTPTSFQFNIATTPSARNLLQLFIVTDGSAPAMMSLSGVPEPIPAGSDCSLLISSRIVFERILPASFADAKSFLVMSGTPPTDTTSPWMSTATSGSVNVPISIHQREDEGNIRVNQSAVPVSMAGLTIKAGTTPTYDLAMSYGGGFQQDFDIYGCSEGHFQGMCLGGRWDSASVWVNTSLAAALPVTIVGKGQEQEIQLAKGSVDVQADGALNSGPCSNADLQAQVVQAYRAAARQAIPDALPTGFSAISFFALKNLLFPAQNMVDMSTAYVPGDLVILGQFATS